MERREFRGERLKYARIFRGKSLTELANESGISKQLISQYENGDSRPSHERLFNISEIPLIDECKTYGTRCTIV